MNVKDLRALTRLTQKEFGERLGLTSQSITKYESGANVSETVKKLIRYEFSRFLPEEEQLEPIEKPATQIPHVPPVKNNDFVRILRETIDELRNDKEFLKALLMNKPNEST